VIQFIPRDLNIDFLKISRPFVIATMIAAAISVVAMFKPGLNYGIDFTGGAEVQLRVPDAWDTSKLRGVLANGGLSEATVIRVEDTTAREFIVKLQVNPEEIRNVSERVEQILSGNLKSGEYEIQKVDVVGPAAGQELRTDAIMALFVAALGILIYITFRFDVRFAPGIVRALIFDVILTIGAWIALGKEFNLATVAALLTIAGYSCNDTIVIYDRIREFGKTHPNLTLYEIVNRSINLNLSRTVITVLTTNMTVWSMWLLGGPVISDFALAMLIGFSIVLFSTIFVANPMVMYMEKRRLAKESNGKHASSNGRPVQARV